MMMPGPTVRKHITATLVFSVALGCLTGCNKDPVKELPNKKPTTPEQNKRETFFWKDRLSIPPFEETVSDGTDEWASKILATAVERGASTLDHADTLAKMGAPVGAFEAALNRTEDPGLKVSIVAAAGQLGADAAPMLCRALRQTPVEVPLLAARALGRIDAPWTLPRLIKALGQYDAHPELIVRVEAAASLIAKENYSPIPVLLKVLKEHTRLQDNREREWTERTRIAYEKEEAWRALAPILGEGLRFSPNAPYDAQADVVEELEQRYLSRRSELWASSPELTDPGLLAIIDRLVEGFRAFQIRNVDNARYTLVALGPKAIPRLVDHLSDSPVYVRVHVLEVLQQLAQDERRSPILEAAAKERLTDDAPAVRAEAARLLGALRTPSATETVLPAVDDDDQSVQLAAIQALGDSGSEDGDARLASIADGVRGDAWATAHASLYRRGQAERLDALIKALIDGDLGVRAAALDALLWLGSDTATFPLTGDESARRDASTIVRDSTPPPAT